MCRNIRPLFNYDPPSTEDDIRAAALQYVRKVSGSQKPSMANAEAFDRAVDEIAAAIAAQRRARPTGGLQRLLFLRPADGNVMGLPIAQCRLQLLPEPGVVNDQIPESRSPQFTDMVDDQRLTPGWQQGFRGAERERTHTFALARRQNHGFHGRMSPL